MSFYMVCCAANGQFSRARESTSDVEQIANGTTRSFEGLQIMFTKDPDNKDKLELSHDCYSFKEGGEIKKLDSGIKYKLESVTTFIVLFVCTLAAKIGSVPKIIITRTNDLTQIGMTVGMQPASKRQRVVQMVDQGTNFDTLSPMLHEFEKTLATSNGRLEAMESVLKSAKEERDAMLVAQALTNSRYADMEASMESMESELSTVRSNLSTAVNDLQTAREEALTANTNEFAWAGVATRLDGVIRRIDNFISMPDRAAAISNIRAEITGLCDSHEIGLINTFRDTQGIDKMSTIEFVPSPMYEHTMACILQNPNVYPGTSIRATPIGSVYVPPPPALDFDDI